MNAEAFRYFFEYHFSENRKLWDMYVTQLTQELFSQDIPYSHGSVRNQLVHIMNTDTTWFNELRGMLSFELPEPSEFTDRSLLRTNWDNVERDMRAYMAILQDETLFTRPILFEEDKNLIVWQVLLHVVNHATDHRAQLLRDLHDLGLKTGPQDFIFYVFDHM